MEEYMQFMVDFNIPLGVQDQPKFQRLIPQQRSLINSYFMDGKLVSYALSLEKSRMWAVFNAKSEEDVIVLVEQLPLTKYIRDYEISILTFYNMISNAIPAFSVN
jgi:hypothetical protein